MSLNDFKILCVGPEKLDPSEQPSFVVNPWLRKSGGGTIGGTESHPKGNSRDTVPVQPLSKKPLMAYNAYFGAVTMISGSHVMDRATATELPSRGQIYNTTIGHGVNSRRHRSCHSTLQTHCCCPNFHVSNWKQERWTNYALTSLKIFSSGMQKRGYSLSP